MYYYDKASTATDKYIKLGDCEDVIVDTKANIEQKKQEKLERLEKQKAHLQEMLKYRQFVLYAAEKQR